MKKFNESLLLCKNYINIIKKQTYVFIKKSGKKINKQKELHVAVGAIALVTLVCLSFTTVSTLKVYADENATTTVPTNTVLVAQEIVAEPAPVIVVEPLPVEEPEPEVVEPVEPVGPSVDYSNNLIHESNTDMSYMNVDLSYNADIYSNGYYCDDDNIAHENDTDAILVAMGSQYDYGQYYEVTISNYGTVIVKKVEEKGHTQNNEGYIGPNGDSVELMVCDGFDPNGAGKSSNLGMYVTDIYKANY